MIAGHHHIIEHLTHLYEIKALPHGMVFYGDTRVGKCTVARAFADYLERGGGEFKNVAVGLNTRPLSDAIFIEPDIKGTIGIDEVRRVRQFLRQRPSISDFRIVVVHDAELLTREAQNAFLKIAEEPPSYGIIILATRDYELLLPTLSSRLHKYYFSHVRHDEMVKWIQAELNQQSKSRSEELAKKSFGKPGLAYALLNDEKLNTRIKKAKKFLIIPPSARKAFLKEMIDDDEFNLSLFIDALLIVIFGDDAHGKMLHSVIELRKTVDSVPVNPRIQLSNLWTII